jgi:hypothetical protein
LVQELRPRKQASKGEYYLLGPRVFSIGMSILEIVIPIWQRKTTILTDEKIVIWGSAFCRKFKFSTESDDFPREPNGLTAAPVYGLWHFL